MYQNLLIEESDLVVALSYRTEIKKEIKLLTDLKAINPEKNDQLEIILTDAERFLKAIDLKISCLMNTLEYRVKPFLNFLPKFKDMEAAEYDAIKIRYQNLLQKITDLSTVIKKTYCPVKLAFFNTDMRLLISEKEEILTYLIEQKP